MLIEIRVAGSKWRWRKGKQVSSREAIECVHGDRSVVNYCGLDCLKILLIYLDSAAYGCIVYSTVHAEPNMW